MRARLRTPDIGPINKGLEADVARILTVSMVEFGEGFLGDLRADTARALGRRVGNTWRRKNYPVTGDSLEPATFVFSKAANLIEGHRSNHVINPTDGRRYIAIPTQNARKGGGSRGVGKKMTPLEVETMFNQDLIWRPNRKRPGAFLAFVNVVAAANKRGFRPATKGRLAKGRKPVLVLMFNMVRSVTMTKKIDPDAVAARWDDRLPGIIDSNWR